MTTYGPTPAVGNVEPLYARHVHGGQTVDYVPAAAVSYGDVIVQGDLVGIALRDIAASEAAALTVEGCFEFPKAASDGGMAVGTRAYWDDTNKVATGISGANAYLGKVETTAATAAVVVRVQMEAVANGGGAAFDGKTAITSAVSLTLVAATHSGGVVRITGATQTVTLPTGVAGMDFTIVNDAVDGSLLTVDLDGSEIIAGANLTMAATKTVVNTALTAKRGDYIQLVCNVAATSWRCVAKRGTWVATA